MSFRCDACQEAQEPRTKPSLLVAERRDREYSVTRGWEIVREEKLCPTCYDAHRQEALASA